MIPLSPLFAALTFFDPRQLLQLPMQLLYRPTHLVLLLNNLRVDGLEGTI
jgi:hypothetical protein